MKSIFHEYAGAILGVISILAIWGMVGLGMHRSPDTILGKYGFGVSGNGSFSAGEMNQAYAEYLERISPKITFSGRRVTAKSRIDWADVFRAEDADGLFVPVHVLRVDDKEINASSYAFPRAGVYDCLVEAEDDFGKISRGLIQIPVQRKS